ncbi:MAG TPA: hypothetical protein PKA64_16695 [Myxococcota bacterium]|nr:hypothetical protein [Myxococcota bacterium]
MAEATGAGDMVVVDLGKHKRKRIKQLRKGEGSLTDDVREAIEELREAGTIGADAVPVVFVVKEKQSDRFGKLF